MAALTTGELIELKLDVYKPRFELIAPRAELGLAMLLTVGAQKYGDWNWKGLSDSDDRSPVYGAVRRHYNAMARGEVFDSEYGLPHALHLFANGMFLTEWALEDLDLNCLWEGVKQVMEARGGIR